MYITQSYKYQKNEIIYVGGEVPEGAELIETMDILNAEDGKRLVRISDDKKLGSCLWLKEGDSQENYTEIEREEKDAE